MGLAARLTLAHPAPSLQESGAFFTPEFQLFLGGVRGGIFGCAGSSTRSANPTHPATYRLAAVEAVSNLFTGATQ